MYASTPKIFFMLHLLSRKSVLLFFCINFFFSPLTFLFYNIFIYLHVTFASYYISLKYY